ncbi:TonB-dependent receptor [Dechloromonas sp.]|uniref:TonB-dependent receptor n=1 Tax=Dechloromonas sp. TaxID=1917218 RepID=UPI00122205D9|nr:TonB-dependent receptor [Dechloromonas sp.]MBU3695197.1 TonB-dependent receptor [Dechloromonas sp.]TEX47699.1 MAG: TonB-dependent receptor [Rhodocyclaceae bacterium]
MGYRIRPLSAAVAIIFSGALPGAAVAQSRPAPVLDEIIVKAQREAPVSTSVGNSSLQQLRPATSDTASLLRDVPGVALQGAGGTSSLPIIRGLADDRLRIQVDGMDFIASCPNHMNPPLSYVDPTNVGKLKVWAGITPVSVGGDSIGGTIVAETRPAEFAAAGQGSLLKGEIGSFYRSNGNAFGASLSATAATESLSLSYNGAFAKADNYKAGGDFKTTNATGRAGHLIARDEVGSSAYETRTHTVGFAMKGGDHLIEAKVGYQEVPEQLFPNQRMDMLDNEQKRFNLRYLGQFGWGALEARAYHERVSHYMDFGPDKQFQYGTAPGMPMYTKSKTTGVNLKADVDMNPNNLLRIGSLYQTYRLDDWWPPSGTGGMSPGTFENIKDGQRDRIAAFGEWESRFAPQWLSLLGVRYENVRTDTGNVRGYSTAAGAMGAQVVDANAFNARNHERTDNNWDMTALVRHTPSETADLEVGFARKVRSPNLYERYTWSTWSMAAVMNNYVGDGNGYIGNMDLKAEKAHTLSATLDLHSADRRYEFKATPYYTHVDDYIDAVRCNNTTTCAAPNATTNNRFVTLQYANQTARLFGLDLSGRMPLASTGAGDFALRGLLNYTNGKNTDTGDELYNIMPLNGKLVLSHRLGGWDNAFEVVGVTGKSKVSDVRNEIKTSGYSLLNLRASYSWQRVRLDLGVENLLDKFYYQPTGGAYTGQGTTMSINGIPWGIGVPGMGRSIYAGVNVKF